MSRVNVQLISHGGAVMLLSKKANKTKTDSVVYLVGQIRQAAILPASALAAFLGFNYAVFCWKVEVVYSEGGT